MANYCIPDMPNFHSDFRKRFLKDQEHSFTFIFSGLQQYFLEFVALNATKAKGFTKLVINETVDDLNFYSCPEITLKKPKAKL